MKIPYLFEIEEDTEYDPADYSKPDTLAIIKFDSDEIWRSERIYNSGHHWGGEYESPAIEAARDHLRSRLSALLEGGPEC